MGWCFKNVEQAEGSLKMLQKALFHENNFPSLWICCVARQYIQQNWNCLKLRRQTVHTADFFAR